MKTIIIAILSLSLIGCGSELPVQVIEVRTQRISHEYLQAQREIDATMIKLLQALSENNENNKENN
jgi:uncharacterized protein YcfL